MSRRRIAVLIASIDREYQQDFTSGLEKAAAKRDMDICIFNTQGHMNVTISSTSCDPLMVSWAQCQPGSSHST